MRTLQDARSMMDLMRAGTLARAVIVGGGPLGLEWAQGLKQRGVHVTLLMRENRFLPGALDDVASDLLLAPAAPIGRRGRPLGRDPGRVAIRRRTPRGGGHQVRHTLPCRVLGVAIGVICNTDFSRAAGSHLVRAAASWSTTTCEDRCPMSSRRVTLPSTKGELCSSGSPLDSRLASPPTNDRGRMSPTTPACTTWRPAFTTSTLPAWAMSRARKPSRSSIFRDGPGASATARSW